MPTIKDSYLVIDTPELTEESRFLIIDGYSGYGDLADAVIYSRKPVLKKNESVVTVRDVMMFIVRYYKDRL